MDGGQCPPYIRISRLRGFSIHRVGLEDCLSARNCGMFQVECRGKMPLLHNFESDEITKVFEITG